MESIDVLIPLKKKRAPRPKKGVRHIGGRNISCDSSYEANFARFLQYLKERGEITHFIKNTSRFEFSTPIDLSGVCKTGGIQKAYTPDFLVFYPDGSYKIFEIKGRMNNRDNEKRKQFEKDYAGLHLEYITKLDLLHIQKSLDITGWEVIR